MDIKLDSKHRLKHLEEWTLKFLEEFSYKGILSLISGWNDRDSI